MKDSIFADRAELQEISERELEAVSGGRGLGSDPNGAAAPARSTMDPEG